MLNYSELSVGERVARPISGIAAPSGDGAVGIAGPGAASDQAREPAAWIWSAPGRWYVAHTRARNEKFVAAALARHAVWNFLPLRSVQRTYAKRRVTFQVPLFPGYVFVCGDHRGREIAWRTNRVANLIEVADQRQIRSELAQIARVVASDAAVDLLPAMEIGQRCRIRSGLLKDVEGVVVQRGGRWRLHLAVSTLGQSAVVDIDAALLEPIS